jgi:hypothetical protein
VFVVAALCVASPAWAEVRVTLSAVDPQAAKEADGLSAKEATKAAEARHLKRAAIAKETASRLQERLDAAGFRHATAQAVGGVGEVLVVVYDREATRGWVERVVFGEGELALRPVLAYGELWGSLEGGLPEGLEVRGEGAQAYVYGLDAGAMVELAGRLALADASVHVAPSGPGWKLVALGESVASHRDVSGVKLGRGRLGGAYVTMRLSGAASARWSGGEAREWAVVLDGEVVTLSPRPSAERSRELLVMCPKAAHSDRECASQIAGRAAAHIPVVLMPASGRGSEGDE